MTRDPLWSINSEVKPGCGARFNNRHGRLKAKTIASLICENALRLPASGNRFNLVFFRAGRSAVFQRHECNTGILTAPCKTEAVDGEYHSTLAFSLFGIVIRDDLIQRTRALLRRAGELDHCQEYATINFIRQEERGRRTNR